MQCLTIPHLFSRYDSSSISVFAFLPIFDDLEEGDDDNQGKDRETVTAGGAGGASPSNRARQWSKDKDVDTDGGTTQIRERRADDENTALHSESKSKSAEEGSQSVWSKVGRKIYNGVCYVGASPANVYHYLTSGATQGQQGKELAEGEFRMHKATEKEGNAAAKSPHGGESERGKEEKCSLNKLAKMDAKVNEILPEIHIRPRLRRRQTQFSSFYAKSDDYTWTEYVKSHFLFRRLPAKDLKNIKDKFFEVTFKKGEKDREKATVSPMRLKLHTPSVFFLLTFILFVCSFSLSLFSSLSFFLCFLLSSLHFFFILSFFLSVSCSLTLV